VDASFDFLDFFLGTHTILIFTLSFGGMGLDGFLNVPCFDSLRLYPKTLGPLGFLALYVEASKCLFLNPMEWVE